jgi:hypothetical protein
MDAEHHGLIAQTNRAAALWDDAPTVVMQQRNGPFSLLLGGLIALVYYPLTIPCGWCTEDSPRARDYSGYHSAPDSPNCSPQSPL